MRRILCAGLLVCLLLPEVVFSARLYLEPVDIELRQGETAVLSVRLDVERDVDECVNLADVVLEYPASIQPIDTSIGNSILRLWVEEPTIDRTNNRITFAGGIPNGYCGRIPGDPQLTNTLAQIVFRAPAETIADTATITFSPQTTLYLNDGFGTQIVPEAFGATIALLDEPGDVSTDPWLQAVEADTIPPEPFSIYLERDDAVFQGRYFIVFGTTDKQTGIASYEVMEEPLADQWLFRFGAVGVPWVPARSPYVLKDQTLNSTIRVRAIDKAGNERIATFVPDPSLRQSVWMLSDWIMVGVGSVLFLFFILLFVILVRKRRQGATLQNPDTRASHVEKNYE